MSRRMYSAVVDPHGAFPSQARTLVRSLIELAGVRSDDIILHVVGPQQDFSVARSLEKLGVDLVQVEPFPNHPWCNKLQQLAPLVDRQCDEVVLLDCDVIVLEEPPGALGGVAAKIVDFGNPSIAILESLFHEAKLPLVRTNADIDRAETAWANANGGLYVVDGRVLESLAPAWLHWANWCIQRRARFRQKWMHIDQVAFSMAISSERISFHPLERGFNLPTHVAQDASLDCVPSVLHYHSAVDDQSLLRPIAGLRIANEAIARVNSWLMNSRSNHADNMAPSNERYSPVSSVESDLGQSDETSSYKVSLVSSVADTLCAPSIAYVFDEDGQLRATAPGDFSGRVAEFPPSSRDNYLANLSRKVWGLHDVALRLVGPEVELLVCWDVLPRLSEASEYHEVLRSLLADGRPLLVSGYEEEPVEYGSTSFFHEPLSETLADYGRLSFPMGAYGGLTVQLAFAADHFKESGVSQRILQYATPLVNHPLLLVDALITSARSLGFFPNRLARCIEYPWIVEQLSGQHRLRVLDAGAGVSPLPLMLANRGHHVITADPHPLVRNGTPREQWNEWGFLDYAELDGRITSWHVPYEQTDDECELDTLVSVSVIEHLPSSVRREWLAKASRQLVSGGLLLLTADTFPFTQDLWNFSEGIEVEDRGTHGNISALIQEIRSAGFDRMAIEYSNWLPASRVGMARIRASRS